MNRKTRLFIGGVFTLVIVFSGLFSTSVAYASETSSEDFRQIVEADWARQEHRFDREPTQPEAIQIALQRGERLLADLRTLQDAPDLQGQADELARLQVKAGRIESLSPEERLSLYHEIRWLNREIAFENPLVESTPIVFLKRRRFICQMLHEYLGYYYDYADIAGGGIYRLENPGSSFACRDLLEERLPRGNYTTLSLTFDAQTLYFAFAERAAVKPDYYSPDRKGFHLYAMNVDGTDLRQLTDGLYDDFDPCEMPNGDLMFMSTRRGGFGRCHNLWEPLPAYTLHSMKPDGSSIKTLSFHETNEWHPSVLADGRIVYIRWDYVDRSAANFHGLWTVNPDGSNPMALFGNYTMTINACYQPHPIPGSNRILFVAGAHHADVGGSLVIFDPSQAALDPETGEDDFRSLEVLTPEICFPEGVGWPTSYFHSPWPLSENYYLVSFSFDPLPGMGANVDQDTQTGLYLFDRFGNMELLYRDEDISSMYPLPLRARSVPPQIPSTLDPSLGQFGEYLLTDLNQSHFPFPEGRTVRSLRIFQILPKSETHVANQPRMGYANAESARMLLGEVPVEEDGSAYFRAPANIPLHLQAIDDQGKAVQGMRSVTYLQPGERRGCVGCHEPVRQTATLQRTIALHRIPSDIAPGPDGTQPWSYPRLIQPILDQHCIRCHDGAGKRAERPNLTSESRGTFTASYESLKPFVRWYEWGDQTITPIVTRPGNMPSTVSPLIQVLDSPPHVDQVSLSDEERRKIYLWLDGNAAFYGCYSPSEQLAQLEGKAVPPPKLQ